MAAEPASLTDAASLEQLTTSRPAGRQLQQNAFCPDGCYDLLSCVQDATMAGLRCQKCKNNLRVNVINGMCSEFLVLSAPRGGGGGAPRHTCHSGCFMCVMSGC